ncbi:MAG: hypothetical protein EZS28_004280 [Streblomastix strix]|uniref:Uncharacterized protein n=1 Tax=Streblomastix strix TaxID=222440 RepID=A0A5J4WYY4_9EUKA|nr:MAG: hypothetical protein EZS28_004280 [Streblomastix strix]
MEKDIQKSKIRNSHSEDSKDHHKGKRVDVLKDFAKQLQQTAKVSMNPSPGNVLQFTTAPHYIQRRNNKEEEYTYELLASQQQRSPEEIAQPLQQQESQKKLLSQCTLGELSNCIAAGICSGLAHIKQDDILQADDGILYNKSILKTGGRLIGAATAAIESILCKHGDANEDYQIIMPRDNIEVQLLQDDFNSMIVTDDEMKEREMMAKKVIEEIDNRRRRLNELDEKYLLERMSKELQNKGNEIKIQKEIKLRKEQEQQDDLLKNLDPLWSMKNSPFLEFETCFTPSQRAEISYISANTREKIVQMKSTILESTQRGPATGVSKKKKKKQEQQQSSNSVQQSLSLQNGTELNMTLTSLNNNNNNNNNNININKDKEEIGSQINQKKIKKRNSRIQKDDDDDEDGDDDDQQQGQQEEQEEKDDQKES